MDESQIENNNRSGYMYIFALLRREWKASLGLGLFFLAFFFYVFAAPPEWNGDYIFTIKEGDSAGEIASKLKANSIIRSEGALKFILGATFSNKKIKSGNYYFNGNDNIFVIASRIVNADFNLNSVKVLIPEGTSVMEISKILSEKLYHFDAAEFVRLARQSEGYLFSDTYFIEPSAKPDEVIKMLRTNFDKRIASIDDLLGKSGRPLEDIISMASIIEEEASSTESRLVVSGILWKRIAYGMPLQVDASFRYINGKTTKELTTADLQINSPYNSYKYAGLPPTPISNPGLDSIKAAANPTKNPYFYFLSDKDGKMHYAVTLEEHNRNKEKYIN